MTTVVFALGVAAAGQVGGASPGGAGVATAATAKQKPAKKPSCRKGYTLRKVAGRLRCLKRPVCRKGELVKLKGRRLVCAARPKGTATTGSGTTTAPGKTTSTPATTAPATTTPAPTTSTTATTPPPPPDPVARATALLAHKVLSKYTSSASPTSSGTSRESRFTFCGDQGFVYFYEYSDAYGGYNRSDARGTWQVTAAEFTPDGNAMRAVVSYTTTQESPAGALPSNQMLVEAAGDKVWVGGEEWGFAVASC